MRDEVVGPLVFRNQPDKSPKMTATVEPTVLSNQMEQEKEHPAEVWRLNQRVSMETVSNNKSLKAHPKKDGNKLATP